MTVETGLKIFGLLGNIFTYLLYHEIYLSFEKIRHNELSSTICVIDKLKIKLKIGS